MKNLDSVFSSNYDSWETPASVFDPLNKEFNFTLDVCANSDNYKCDFYFDKNKNGLLQEWNGVCWCNPPYGRQIYKWVEKAFLSNCTCVLLLPARTDTKWFHEFIYNKAEIRFLKGRIRFVGSSNPAPFPSMIVIFRR